MFTTAIKKIFQNRQYLLYIILFVLAVSLFTFLQADLTFADPDSFYHAKMALVLRDQGAITAFPWLTATELQYSYIDHHFLYHLILVPFVTFFNPLVGLKIATILLASLSIVVFYWFLRRLNVLGAFWYALFLLTVNPFIFRLNLAKAQALVLIVLLLALYLLFNRKYLALIFVSFLYVWLYAGWPLLLGLAGLYLMVYAGISIFQNLGTTIRKPKKKLQQQNLALFFGVAIGLLAGIFFNPYFPKNLAFYWRQTFEIAIFNYQHLIGVGGEWYPYSISELVLQAFPLAVLFLIAAIVFVVSYKKQSSPTWFFALVSLGFLALTLKSRRNVEYLAPMVVIFSALALNVVWPRILEFLKRIKLKPLLPLLLVGVVLPFAISDIVQVKKSYQTSFSFDHLAKPALWLAQNTPVDSIIFHSDWDEFPFLFYYNSHNRYLVGLDPTFMYRFDPGLHQKWVGLVTGQSDENFYPIIKDLFGAQYVLVDYNSNSVFAKNLANNFNFELVFENDEARIYRVFK